MKSRAINIVLILIVSVVPILKIPKICYENTDIIKFIYLLIMGSILLFLFIRNYKTFKLDNKDVIILFFLGLIIVSTIFSGNIKKSIIGERNRYEGLLMYTIYVCIYLSGKRYFNHIKITKFLDIMFYSSIFISLLGVFQQYIDCEFLYPLFNKGICSTFGNSNFFGSYISIILPISLSIFIIYGNKKSFILTILMFYNMISSGTRSAWIAFAIVGIMGIIYLIKQKNKKYFKRAIIIFIIFVIIFIYLFNMPGYAISSFNRLTNDIKVFTENGLQDGMGSGRIIIWKITLKLIIKSPLLGCGPDNLIEGMFKYCREDIVEYINTKGMVIDKAHNEYLHIAATIGIPAMITYLIFIAEILLPKIKLIFKQKIYFIVCLAIISYLVQAFFNISTIGVAPLFWLILGICDSKEKIYEDK